MAAHLCGPEQQQQHLPQQEYDPEEATRAWLQPDETAAQLLARTFVEPLRTGLPLIDRFLAFRGGQVLEIASAAGCGRTTALLQVAATCIMPQDAAGVHYGGKGGHVVCVDLDAKQDPVRLMEMLGSRIYAAQQAAGVGSPNALPLVLESLARFHLVRCHSSFELLAALRVLLQGQALQALAASEAGLACLLLDNVAAHYYLDRAGRGAPAAGTAAAAAGGAFGGGDLMHQGAPLGLYRVHAAVAAVLRGIQQRYRLPIIATKHLLLPGGKEAGKEQDGWAQREVMMKPWQDLVTHRLILRSPSDGGGDGAAAAAAAAARARTGSGAAAAAVHMAKWETPEDPAVIRFTIGDEGIRLC
ncbi:hypothetical protein D9Q98_001520 [Chlorella vulgaris]|uniref:RecA family profile 1 domain-containing protein n=1 Tax=Chlorella vulgaris TaxID=3077 RepID=A0A9D4U2C2_CHLVU|nr:hypothetical protein D9Q98_001520 [Chlorella vulgaris]